MSYREGGYQGTAMKVGALVVALFIGKVAWPVVAPYVAAETEMADLSSAPLAERRLEADPVGAVIKARFPDDHRLLVVELNRAASARDKAGVSRAFSAALQRIVARDGAHLAQAPHASLARAAAARASVLTALEMRPAQCARFVAGTLGPEEVSPRTDALVGALVAARLQAIADGRDRPAGRPAGPPDEATLRSFVESLDSLPVPTASRQLLLGERTPAQATDTARCEAERFALQAADAMPEPAGDRVIAAMLAS